MVNCSYTGEACSRWVIDNSNMDYLYASHEKSDIVTCNSYTTKQLGYGEGMVQSCK